MPDRGWDLRSLAQVDIQTGRPENLNNNLTLLTLLMIYYLLKIWAFFDYEVAILIWSLSWDRTTRRGLAIKKWLSQHEVGSRLAASEKSVSAIRRITCEHL